MNILERQAPAWQFWNAKPQLGDFGVGMFAKLGLGVPVRLGYSGLGMFAKLGLGAPGLGAPGLAFR